MGFTSWEATLTVSESNDLNNHNCVCDCPYKLFNSLAKLQLLIDLMIFHLWPFFPVISLLSARGNTTVCGEFNFAADPEAAYIVLNEYICNTYMACWEFTCLNMLSWVRSS